MYKCNKCQNFEIIDLKPFDQVLIKRCKKCQYVKLSVKRFNKLIELYLYRYPQNLNLYFNTNETLAKLKIHTFLQNGLIDEKIMFNSIQSDINCDECNINLKKYNHNGLELYYCQKDNLIYFKLNQFFEFISKLCNISKKKFVWLRIKMFFKNLFIKG